MKTVLVLWGGVCVLTGRLLRVVVVRCGLVRVLLMRPARLLVVLLLRLHFVHRRLGWWGRRYGLSIDGWLTICLRP